MLKKVVFLDRDGVINQDSPNYIKTWAEFEFLPQSLTAIRNLTSNRFAVIIITNQSAINRDITPRKEVEYIHTMMQRRIESEGGKITDIFFCPHAPDEGCECRKPMPGMIFKAQKKYDIDLASACMVGDSATDIECARNAGCGQAILVKTGNGMTAQKKLLEKNIVPNYVAENLYDAVSHIISWQK